MAELLQHHTNTLQQASYAASDIHDNLDKVVEASKLWSITLNERGFLSDYSLRLGIPLTTLFVGNYGMTSSLMRNVGLFLGGG